MAENFYAAAATTCRFLRGLGVGGISIIASLGLAGRVDAMYLHSDYPQAPAFSPASDYTMRQLYFNAGDYIDRVWYYLLDEGQYRYLDKGQYNLMGGLSYQLGHPAYPKLFERASDQAVGFTNRANVAWLGSGGEQFPIIEYTGSCFYFNAGDYIDRGRYYFLDKGQYYYLDRGQYNLLGGLGYLFGRPYYQRPYDWDSYPHQKPGGYPTPEPSTIGFLAVGAFIIFTSRRRNHIFYRKKAHLPLVLWTSMPKPVYGFFRCKRQSPQVL